MGARGRKPTPTSILKLRGSWRANINGDEPKPPSGRPPMPRTLSAPAKEVWKRVARRLEKVPGLLTKIDGEALGRYCQLLARYWECEAKIAQFGETLPVKDKEGNIVGVEESPWSRISIRLAEKLTRLEAEFGMTPSSRARISVRPPEAPPSNGKDRFFAG